MAEDHDVILELVSEVRHLHEDVAAMVGEFKAHNQVHVRLEEARAAEAVNCAKCKAELEQKIDRAVGIDRLLSLVTGLVGGVGAWFGKELVAK